MTLGLLDFTHPTCGVFSGPVHKLENKTLFPYLINSTEMGQSDFLNDRGVYIYKNVCICV